MAIFEVLNNQQSYFNRYFRRNVGDDDYATHTSVTVDRIVMDVLPSAGNGNLGLPTGAPVVTDNVLQKIDFAYSGSISELYRNGSDYFKGIIANVKYYLAGELIHSWSINSNSNTESDSVDGLVLTIINGNADDWGLFDRQADGDWLGQELIVNGGFDSASGWVMQANWSISNGKATSDGTSEGIIYRTLARPSEYQVSGVLDEASSGEVYFYNGNNYSSSVSSPGPFSITVTNANDSYAFFTMKAFLGNEPVLESVSLKEVLKNA